jgi:hypothetical protein
VGVGAFAAVVAPGAWVCELDPLDPHAEAVIASPVPRAASQAGRSDLFRRRGAMCWPSSRARARFLGRELCKNRSMLVKERLVAGGRLMRRPRWYLSGLALCGVLAAILWLGLRSPGPARAAPRVPFGFVGMVVDGPMVDGGMKPGAIDREFDQMVSTGVETVRVVFYWDDVQPYGDFAHLPASARGHYADVGGIPTDLSRIDAMVRRAAQRRMTTLPVVLRAPSWARIDPNLPYSPPRDPKAYADFVELLVRRYGRGGSFWSANPKLPRLPPPSWQIWNEPAGGAFPHGPSAFWQDKRPFEGPYLELLREARARIKAVDPRAQVVLAGLFGAS